MAILDQQRKVPTGFIPSSSGPEGAKKIGESQLMTIQNPDALDINLDD